MSSPSAWSAAPAETEGAGAGGGRKYKGVRLRKWGKWVSEIRLPNSRERVWLGSYDAPEKAARAFDAAFVCLRGAQAAACADLNFPDSPPPPCHQSVDPQVVQAAALSHANRAQASRHVREAALGDERCSPAVPAALSLDQCLFTQQGPDLDWRTVMADQPPLFSPTAGWGSNEYDYLQLQAPPPGGDQDVPMEESDYGGSASLWSF